ncbi:unnamed protein product [Chondrus crispus]|uniref:Uncharacterized protein n=1 Tax=Chondrus crispus TaxID=2769 RepID=R7QS26_CHOCR|nr:unnamed protein product [Chondrus crispus]CDF41292.1 unnamed protein product [Chondrus crispus]|eukprot:XP_005711586.1 unnamed protein product [Chondrus crispus]
MRFGPYLSITGPITEKLKNKVMHMLSQPAAPVDPPKSSSSAIVPKLDTSNSTCLL